GVETADDRLVPVLRLISMDRPLAEQALRRVAAEVNGDGRRYMEEAAARVAAVAQEHGIPIPRIPNQSQASAGQESPTKVQWRGNSFSLPDMRVPPFVAAPSLVDLLTGLRNAGRSRGWDDPGAWDDVALALGYHLGDLIDNGREDDACRLLRFFARDT